MRPLKRIETPRRRPVGAAFLVVASLAGATLPTLAADPTDAICGPRHTSIDVPASIAQRHDDIPFLGDTITQEARATTRTAPGPSCGRVDIEVREVAFETPFGPLREDYLAWLETQLTGPHPLTSAYVRNHGVTIVDRAGEFRFVDSIKPEPDHAGRLEIHLTEERGAGGRTCRQVILRYSRRGEAPCEPASP